MRKQIVSFVTLLILSMIPITPKAHVYERVAKSMSVFDERSGKAFEYALYEHDLYLYLLEWGTYNGDNEIGPFDWRNKHEVWVWSAISKKMVHYNTDDGTFIYDCTLNGTKIQYHNAYIIQNSEAIPMESKNGGFLEFNALNPNERIYFTVDNYNVFRFFQAIPYDLLPNELIRILCDHM